MKITFDLDIDDDLISQEMDIPLMANSILFVVKDHIQFILDNEPHTGEGKFEVHITTT